MNAVARRLLSSIPALIGILTITFFLLPLVPGDPVDLMLGEQASIADKSALRHELDLDLPLPQRFAKFTGGLVQGNLGTSFTTHQPVTALIGERLPATLELAVSSMLLALAIGIPMGVFAAIKKRKAFDHFARVFSVTGSSLPSFWIGPLLVYIFAIKHIGILAESGFQSTCESCRIEAEFTLRDDRFAVANQKLDRIFDRENVRVLRVVDVVDHRRKRRRFSRPGDTRDKNETAFVLRNFLDHFWKFQLFEIRNIERNIPDDHPD